MNFIIQYSTGPLDNYTSKQPRVSYCYLLHFKLRENESESNGQQKIAQDLATVPYSLDKTI